MVSFQTPISRISSQGMNTVRNGFMGLSDNEKAEIVEEALQLYCNGALLKDIAPKYGVSVKTLYRLIVSTNPRGWWAAQQSLWWCTAEDALEAGALSGNRKAKRLLNRAEWRLNQIDAKRSALRDKHVAGVAHVAVAMGDQGRPNAAPRSEAPNTGEGR